MNNELSSLISKGEKRLAPRLEEDPKDQTIKEERIMQASGDVARIEAGEQYMVPIDAQGSLTYWQRLSQELKATGKYQKLAEEAEQIYLILEYKKNVKQDLVDSFVTLVNVEGQSKTDKAA